MLMAAGLALAALLSAAPLAAADLDMQLEAAIHREIVLGDLIGATSQYKTIAAQAGKARPLAARALLQLGQCLEKMGQRSAAHDAYARIANEYADQREFAMPARARLTEWADSLAAPRNLNFSDGAVGKVPPGWFVPSLPKDANYLAELRRQGCRSTSGCAVLQVPLNAPSRVANLMQSFSASAYRGKTVRLRAWLRLEAAEPTDRAQMWLNVDRPDRKNGFFDNMDDRPVVSPGWTLCEIVTRIDDDATFIDFGVMSIGRGRAWVDDVAFDVIPPAGPR